MSETNKTNKWMAQLKIYPSYVEVQTPTHLGSLNKIVSIESVASVFTGLPMQTGWLPQNTLSYHKSGNNVHMVVCIEPKKYKLLTPRRTYNVPMPAFIFAGHNRGYQLFALAETGWPTEKSKLYYPPLTNVFNGGGICTGSVRVPACKPETIWKAWDLIVGSYFTGHLIRKRCATYDSDVRELWAAIDGMDAFPVDELQSMNRRLKSVVEAK